MLRLGVTHLGGTFKPLKRSLGIAERALAAVVVERGFVHCVNNSRLGCALKAGKRLGRVLFRAEALLGAESADIHRLDIAVFRGEQRPFIALFFVLRRADSLLIAHGKVQHSLDMTHLGGALEHIEGLVIVKPRKAHTAAKQHLAQGIGLDASQRDRLVVIRSSGAVVLGVICLGCLGAQKSALFRIAELPRHYIRYVVKDLLRRFRLILPHLAPHFPLTAAV